MSTQVGKKIAVVTGANKGIGLEAVKILARVPGLHVILTARNESLGLEALGKLNDKNIEFHQLDITDESSIVKLANTLKTKYGGLDILVNNAGMAFKGNAFDENVARTTINTNYFGTLQACKHLLPLVRDGGRVVNVSSQAGSLSKVSPELKSKFTSSTLTTGEITNLMNSFITAVSKNTYKEEGWPQTTYGVSKVGVTALTKVLAREEKRNILINCCCPGWCNTDMSSNSGTRTAEQGANSLVFLSLLPSDSKINGKFYRDEGELEW